ncbi:MAG: SUMF1/EgtB/PvdO family nonheme iron enzyme, partial [Pirellulaceae bacterium]|nr:SUMF1/EgtB/PvdO family nonheme iron enzyme [Pirellulaceae bacterium]
LLKIARDVAAGTGDAVTALQAVERLLEQFDEPAAELIGDTLLTAARQATTSAQHKAVAEAALSIAAKLSDADQYETALRLCEAARSSAQRAKLFPLAKELTARIEETKRQQLLSEDYRKALNVLENKPTDPAANLAAGRHLCFVKGNWERGVPMLALGSDTALKAAAIKDLRGADSADEQAATGDAWWDLAEAKQGEERDVVRLRAGFWYRQAEPKLAGGLAGLKIKQRLEVIAKLGREIPTAPSLPANSQTPPLAITPFDEKTARQHQAAWAKHLKVPVLWTNSIGMRFALIPPGEFDMGATEEEVARLLQEAKARKEPAWYIARLPSEAPKHRVRITRPYYAGIYEVTQAEYERVLGTNPSQFKANPIRPVEEVTWHDAVEFCRRLSEAPQEKTTGATYRLLTEAEWEYACRAGTTTRFSFGDDAGVLGQYAWWKNNSRDSTQPIGQLRPNAFGLFDMHGNVWEWCADWHAVDYYTKASAEDPVGPESGSARVLRGGSWNDDFPGPYRGVCRNYNGPDRTYRGWGFRVSRTITP